MPRENLRLVLCRTTSVNDQERHFLDSCRRSWFAIWTTTFSELGIDHEINESEFSRHDFVVMILDRDELAGFCFFRLCDLHAPHSLEDSWFRPWPRELLFQLSSNYRTALVPSWLSVLPAYRRSNHQSDLPVTELLCEIMHLACLDVEAEICFGTPRRDRSVHVAMKKAGALSLSAPVKHFGVDIDLMAFIPDEKKAADVSVLGRMIWDNRIDHRTSINPNKERRNEIAF